MYMNAIEQLQQNFNVYLQKQFNLDQNTATRCRLELNIDENKQIFGNT